MPPNTTHNDTLDADNDNSHTTLGHNAPSNAPDLQDIFTPESQDTFNPDSQDMFNSDAKDVIMDDTISDPDDSPYQPSAQPG